LKTKNFTASIRALIITIVFCSCGQDSLNTVANNSEKFDDIEKTSLLNKKFFHYESIESTILRFSCTVYQKGKVIDSWEAHCFLYANRGGRSYLALPYHSFPYDSTKAYSIQLTDLDGKTIAWDWSVCLRPEKGDAEMIVGEEINQKGILSHALSAKDAIASKPLVGDSAILLVPFNSRDVHKKYGIIRSSNSLEMKTLWGEPGDSGGLVVGRNGVIGIAVSTGKDGRERMSYFVPISVFEELYIRLVRYKQNE
jgi:hypothetical protein